MANYSGLNNLSQGTPVKKDIYHPPGYIVASSIWQNTTLGTTLKKKIGVIFGNDLGIVDFYCSKHAFLFISEADLIMANSGYKRRLVKFRKGYTDNQMNGVVMVENNGCTKSLHGAVQKFAVLELHMRLVLIKSQEDAAQFLVNTVNSLSSPKKNYLKIPVTKPPRQIMVSKLLFMIPSIGEIKVRRLLDKFKNFSSIGNASETELEEAIGSSSAKTVYNFFHREV